MKKISIVLISLLLVSSVFAGDLFRLSGNLETIATPTISQDSDSGSSSGSSSSRRSHSRNSADDDIPERDDIITDILIEEEIIDSEEETEIIVLPTDNKTVVKNKGDIRVIIGILISGLIVIAGLCVYFIKRGKEDET